MKKYFAIILCISTLFSVCSFNAFADDLTREDNNPFCRIELDEKELFVSEAKEYTITVTYGKGEYENIHLDCRVNTSDGCSVDTVNVDIIDDSENNKAFCIIRSGVQNNDYYLKAYLYLPNGKIICEDQAKIIIRITADGKDKNEIMWSGECGATENDNVIWSINYYGDLTISGSGNIVFNGEFNSPWKAYGVKTVTVNEGVTGIGAYNFAHLDDLYLIRLPKSLKRIDGHIYIGLKPQYLKIVLSYAGSESEWKNVKTVNDFLESKQIKMFYNGEEPKAFCEITNGDELTIKAGEMVTLYYDYYSAGNPAEIAYASVIKNGEIINGSDIKGQAYFKTNELKKQKIKIKLYDKDNNLLASDDIIVKTTLTDNLLFIIKNIPEFFKSVVLMIGEIPYLLALAFSLGGLLFKTVN